jgi:hypothetical protein
MSALDGGASSRIRLIGGDFRRCGDGDLDGGERFREADGPGEYEAPGGGVGSLTADCNMVEAMTALPFNDEEDSTGSRQMRREVAKKGTSLETEAAAKMGLKLIAGARAKLEMR